MSTGSRRNPTPAPLRIAGALALLCCGSAPLAAQGTPDDDFLARASQARVAGSPDAPVTVYEMADFQCPYCARFASELHPRLKAEYIDAGKVRWVFVNYPLPMHARAWVAAEAALCAAGAGADFWALHDRLFGTQAEWSTGEDPAERFAELAAEAGAEAGGYERCVREDRVAPLLAQDLISAAQTGASGTPAFVVNQELVVGIRPWEDWQKLLDDAVAAAQPSGGSR